MSMGKTLKVATAAYPLDVFRDWSDYAAKIHSWVSEAAENGARLLVFPEYGAMELATLAGLEAAGDLEQSLHAVAERIPAANALHADLAREFNVYILAASAPVFDPEPRTVLFAVGRNGCPGQTDHDAFRTRRLERGWRWPFAFVRNRVWQDRHPDLLRQ
jgi:predicted amidohydrolase